MEKRRLTLILILVTVVLQCVTMLYWAGRKAFFYNDEYYTFEYAQNISSPGNPIEYMTFSDEWKDEEWLLVGALKKRFIVQEGESVFDVPFGESAKRFFTRKNYMWILNALETAFGDKIAPKWLCISLNILILAIFQFLLFYFLAGCLGLDKRTALLAVAMWGFCPYILGFAVFCRFYAWTLLLFLIVIILHWHMWNRDSVVRNLVLEAVAVTLLFLAYNNSELVIVSGGCLVLFFTIGLLARKRFIQAAYYALPVMAGGLMVALRSQSLLEAVFHPKAFLLHDDKPIISAGHRYISRMLETTLLDKMNALWQMVKEFGDAVSGSLYLLAISVVLLIVSLVLARKKLSKGPNGFFLILLGVAVAYWLFCGFYLLSESRYHSMMFLLVTILAWWLLDRLVRYHPLRKLFYYLALCLVLVGAVLPFFRRNVQYVYEDRKPFLEALSEYQGSKNLLVSQGRFIIPYSSVYHLDETGSIYSFFVTEGKSLNMPDLPPTFLCWIDDDYYLRKVHRTLLMEGYMMKPLLKSDLFDVYVCEKAFNSGWGAARIRNTR